MRTSHRGRPKFTRSPRQYSGGQLAKYWICRIGRGCYHPPPSKNRTCGFHRIRLAHSITPLRRQHSVAFAIQVCSQLTIPCQYASRRSASLNDILSQVYLFCLLWNTGSKSAPFQVGTDVPILPITGRHSLFTPSFTPCVVGDSREYPTSEGRSPWGLPCSVSKIIMDAAGAIYRPRTVCPFVSMCTEP